MALVWVLILVLEGVAGAATETEECQDEVKPVQPRALLQSTAAQKLQAISQNEGSCADYGCVGYTWRHLCQCNSKCSRYNNCCDDYEDICAPTPAPTPAPPVGSCARYGCVGYTPANECQCNSLCSRYNNCCHDYGTVCGAPAPATPSPAVPSPPGPSPSPLPPSSNLSQAYWKGVDMSSASAVRLKLASTHVRLSYRQLWEAYKAVWVDLPGTSAECAGKIFEVYSDRCWTPGTQQCGQYRNEGDCYNREHSWPKSWWGGSTNDAYSDLFHVYPSDGFVNSKRSNYPYGNVGNPIYTSSDGSKLGPCSTPGFSGTCFEPSGKHKGNLARGHFYMSLRYGGEFACCSKDGVDGAEIRPWLKALLLQWHELDPVEPWEREFNNRVEAIQGDRNPFIDFESLAETFFK